MAKVKKSAWLMLEVDGKVLMLKRGPKANNPNLWNFPGGNIDPGETAIPRRNTTPNLWLVK